MIPRSKNVSQKEMNKIQQSKKLFINVGVLAIIVGILASVLVVAFSGLQVSAKETGVNQTEIVSTMNMWVEGENQGVMKGGCTEAGLEESIEVFGYSHNVISPRDAASGLPTGKRQHMPLVVVKEIDQATPLLYQALAANENLNDVKLEFRRYNPETQQVEWYFTIDLLNAAIASIQDYSAGTMHHPMETVSFAYQKITWTWEDGGYTATDDWEALNV